MYINSKYDCIIFLFLTVENQRSIEIIKIEKPVGIVHIVPPAQPPPNPPV